MTTKLLNKLTNDQSLEPCGEWFRLCITPNLFTGERLNIGIGIRDAKGHVRVKVVDQISRLASLYDTDSAENILFAAQLTQKAIESGENLPVQNIEISPATPFYNLSADEALNAFFAEQVPLNFTDTKRPKEKSIPSETVREEIYKIIALKEPDIYDLIHPQFASATIEHRGKKRQVTVPLQHPSAFGAIESAGCRTSSTLQLRLMNALLDLEAACEARGIKTMGFFIARPSTDNTQWNLTMDNAIDDVTWRIPTHCRVEVESNLEALANHILDWAPRVA